jgi:hypothetical protein
MGSLPRKPQPLATNGDRQAWDATMGHDEPGRIGRLMSTVIGGSDSLRQRQATVPIGERSRARWRPGLRHNGCGARDAVPSPSAAIFC